MRPCLCRIARSCTDPAQRGGIIAEDRFGVQRFFPLTTVSVGAVPVKADDYSCAEDIASEAAMAKHEAKTRGLGLHVQA